MAEMLSRGYRPSHDGSEGLADGIPSEWPGDWTPALEALEANRQRLRERTPT